MITPVERLRPADGVHGRDGSVPPGRVQRRLAGRPVHAGVQPGEHTPAGDALAGGLGRPAALCWRGPHRGARGSKDGYQITAPPGITINKVVYDDSQLQNIANGRGWIGFTYWNGGTAPVHPNGTAVDAAASGPSLDTTWTHLLGD